MYQFEELDHFFEATWDLLDEAVVSRNSPFRTPMLATYDGNEVHLRTIVLRKVNRKRKHLYFFTDRRSPKVDQLIRYPQTAITFWDNVLQIQIRASGKTEMISQSEEAKNYWNKLPVSNRSNYATTKTPGSVSQINSDGLPDFWNRDLPLEKSEFAFERFMVIKIIVESLDVLHLHKEGHQRALFKRKDSYWEKDWLIP